MLQIPVVFVETLFSRMSAEFLINALI